MCACNPVNIVVINKVVHSHTDAHTVSAVGARTIKVIQLG